MTITGNERIREQVQLLLSMARSQYEDAKDSATVQLSQLGSVAVPHLVEYLAARIEGMEEKRRAEPSEAVTITALGLIGDASAEPVLERAMRALVPADERRASLDGNGDLKMVLVALRRVGSSKLAEWAEWLAPSMKAEDLVEILGGGAIERMTALLDGEDPEQQMAGVRLAEQLKERSATGRLRKMLEQHADELTRALESAQDRSRVREPGIGADRVIEALDVLGASDAVPDVQAWADRMETLRAEKFYGDRRSLHPAFEFVAKHGGQKAVEWLVGFAADGNSYAQQPILGMGERARSELARLANHPDKETRGIAVQLLGQLEATTQKPERAY